MPRQYYTYILTNANRTTLYIGITNNLSRRLAEHNTPSENPETFTGKYNLYHLIYYETHPDPTSAIARETQIKRWGRKKKEDLIATINPEWQFLTPP